MASQSQLPFVVVWFVFSDVRSIHTQATSCGLQCARCFSTRCSSYVTVTSFHLRCFHWGRLNMANIFYIELCRQLIMLTIFGWNYFWVTKYWIIVLVRLKEIFRFEFDLLMIDDFDHFRLRIIHRARCFQTMLLICKVFSAFSLNVFLSNLMISLFGRSPIRKQVLKLRNRSLELSKNIAFYDATSLEWHCDASNA